MCFQTFEVFKYTVKYCCHKKILCTISKYIWTQNGHCCIYFINKQCIVKICKLVFILFIIIFFFFKLSLGIHIFQLVGQGLRADWPHKPIVISLLVQAPLYFHPGRVQWTDEGGSTSRVMNVFRRKSHAGLTLIKTICFSFFFFFFGELGCCGISSLMSTDSLTLTILFIRESGLCCVSGLCATFQSNFVYARNIVGFSKDATSRHVIMLIN